MITIECSELNQRPGVCSAVYGTMHDKELLKSVNTGRE